MYTHAPMQVFTHTATETHTMVGLMPVCKMSESYFLSAFSLIQNDSHKLRAWRKRGDMVCQDFYGFSHICSGPQWCFYNFTVKPPSPDLLDHQGNEQGPYV